MIASLTPSFLCPMARVDVQNLPRQLSTQLRKSQYHSMKMGTSNNQGEVRGEDSRYKPARPP